MTSYNFKRKSDESIEQYHIRLFDDMNIHEASSEELAHYLNLEYGSNYSESKWRKDYSQYRKWKEFIDSSNSTDVSEYKYKETTEIFKDGSQNSDKLIKMSENQSKSPEYLLKAHGFDVNEWEITNARNSIWNSGVDNTLYSSKITVKPKVNGFDIEKAIERATKNIKPYKTSSKVVSGENLLEIFLTDMHWGVNNFDYYKETLDEIIALIQSKKWDTIYIPFGSDLLHNNDFKGRTANDTIIEKVDMELAWDESFAFYYPIYEESLKNSKKVVSHYVCGNHDKDFTFGLIKSFSKVFPEIEWDTSSKNKKLLTWENVAILCLHGDKGYSRIGKTIHKEYGKLIADKNVVEIHTGDKHHTDVTDVHGVMLRKLPTKAQTDEWHEEQSFTGSMKCFHIFEYSKDKLKTIYHI